MRRHLAKRFTDAELAAEHHAAVLAVYRHRVHGDPGRDTALDWLVVVSRFALHPHYDEPPEVCADGDDHEGVRPEVP